MLELRLPDVARVIVLIVACVLCRTAYADCTTDAECKGLRVCDKGRCIEPPVTSGSCSVDKDCPGTQICGNQRCAEPPAAAAPPAIAPVPAQPAPVPPPAA